MTNHTYAPAGAARALTLSRAIAAYRAGCLVAETLPDDDFASGPGAAGTWRPWFDLLSTWDAPAADRQEAITALQIVVEAEGQGESPMVLPMIKAALGWLETNGDATPRSLRSPALDQLEVNLHRIAGFISVIDLLLCEFREFTSEERNALVLQMEPLIAASLAARQAFRDLCGGREA